MQALQRHLAERGRAAPQAELVEPGAGAHQDAEGARRDLGIERAGIAAFDHVEPAALVGDQAGEDVEPAGRALGIGEAGVARQLQAFEQRHDIDAALFQHRALGQIDRVGREFGQDLGHRAAAPRQEAGAHPIGDLAQAQIEARRLELVLANWHIGADLADGDEVLDRLDGQDARGRAPARLCDVVRRHGKQRCQSRRHSVPLSLPATGTPRVRHRCDRIGPWSLLPPL